MQYFQLLGWAVATVSLHHFQYSMRQYIIGSQTWDHWGVMRRTLNGTIYGPVLASSLNRDNVSKLCMNQYAIILPGSYKQWIVSTNLCGNVKLVNKNNAPSWSRTGMIRIVYSKWFWYRRLVGNMVSIVPQ